MAYNEVAEKPVTAWSLSERRDTYARTVSGDRSHPLYYKPYFQCLEINLL